MVHWQCRQLPVMINCNSTLSMHTFSFTWLGANNATHTNYWDQAAELDKSLIRQTRQSWTRWLMLAHYKHLFDLPVGVSCCPRNILDIDLRLQVYDNMGDVDEINLYIESHAYNRKQHSLFCRLQCSWYWRYTVHNFQWFSVTYRHTCNDKNVFLRSDTFLEIFPIISYKTIWCVTVNS